MDEIERAKYLIQIEQLKAEVAFHMNDAAQVKMRAMKARLERLEAAQAEENADKPDQ